MGQGVLIHNDSPNSAALPFPLTGTLGAGQRVVVNSTMALLAAVGVSQPALSPTLRLVDLGTTFTGPYDAPFQGQLNSDGTINSPGSAGPTLVVADRTGAKEVAEVFTAAFSAAAASLGGQAYVPGGTYKWNDVNTVLPRNVSISVAPSAVLELQSSFSSGAVLHCLWNTGRYSNNSLVSGFLVQQTTLSSAPALDSVTLSIAARVTVGNFIGVEALANAGLKWQWFRVVALSGSGPYSVTIDRPVVWSFQSADRVYETTDLPHSITLDGNGATITTTGGDTTLQFWEARNFTVRNFQIDQAGGALGDFPLTMDLGSFRGLFEDIEMRNLGSYGVCMSSTEMCTFNRVRVIRGTGHGLDVLDCIRPVVRACTATNVATGLVVGTNTGDTQGSIDVLVEGCDLSGNTSYGFYATPCQGLTIRDLKAPGNGTSGILIGANCSGIVVDGADVSRSGSNAINIASPGARWSKLVDVGAAGATATGWLFNADDQWVDGSYCDRSPCAAGSHGIECIDTIHISNTTVKLGSSLMYGILVNSGTTYLHNVKVIGSGSAVPWYIFSGGTLIIDVGTCDFSGLAGTITAGGFCNVGPFASLPNTLVGGVPGCRGYDTTGARAVVQKADASWVAD